MALAARKIEFVILSAEAVCPRVCPFSPWVCAEPPQGTPDPEYRRNEWCPGCDARLPPWENQLRLCRRCGYSTSTLDVV